VIGVHARFEFAQHSQNDRHEKRNSGGKGDLMECHGYPDSARHQERCCRGETMDLLGTFAPDDCPCAEEADANNDRLQNSDRVCRHGVGPLLMHRPPPFITVLLSRLRAAPVVPPNRNNLIDGVRRCHMRALVSPAVCGHASLTANALAKRR
jgi:hypothetical protein